MKSIRAYVEDGTLVALLPSDFLPAVMAFRTARYRADRVRVARANRDKGALSIEMAMLVIVLLVGASLVVFAINALVRAKAAKIPKSDTSGQ